MAKTYLLTGGTGFLGSLLSPELIKRGDKIIFLGRGKEGEPFQERVEKILKTIEPNVSLQNISGLEVDLSKNYLGLDNYLDRFSGKIDAIWHLAANLSFKEKDRRETFSTNVGGLKNVLSLAARINCPVYYVSTAYVHGRRPGKIMESDLVRPKQGFNNPYEESKFEAERMVRQWGKKSGNKFVVFRPSILIERERRTMSFFGYYAVAHSLYKLEKVAGWLGAKIPIPFPCVKDSSLNLMPVETAVDWMTKIVSSGERAYGKTFHIVNPNPFLIKDIVRQTFAAAKIKVFVFEAPRWLVNCYFSFFVFLGSLFRSLRGIARKFGYYKYYIIEDNYYGMENVKEILGREEIAKLNFPHDFIYNIAKDFIKKLITKNV